MAEEHASIREGFRKKALDEADKDPISLDWLCHCINEEIGDDAILVHMLPSNADALSRQISRYEARNHFFLGGRRRLDGMALGCGPRRKARGARQDVVSLIGDGGFIYGCPVAAFWTASAYHAPFLSIVFNNNGYAICKQDMPRFAGEGVVKGDMEFEVGFDFKGPRLRKYRDCLSRLRPEGGRPVRAERGPEDGDRCGSSGEARVSRRENIMVKVSRGFAEAKILRTEEAGLR